jgi:hypothetical protein
MASDLAAETKVDDRGRGLAIAGLRLEHIRSNRGTGIPGVACLLQDAAKTRLSRGVLAVDYGETVLSERDGPDGECVHAGDLANRKDADWVTRIARGLDVFFGCRLGRRSRVVRGVMLRA